MPTSKVASDKAIEAACALGALPRARPRRVERRDRPGKSNLPLGLRGKAGGGARVTAGPKRPHLSVRENHVVPTAWQDEALARDGVSREVPCSVLKWETVLGSLDATPKVP